MAEDTYLKTDWKEDQGDRTEAELVVRRRRPGWFFAEYKKPTFNEINKVVEGSGYRLVHFDTDEGRLLEQLDLRNQTVDELRFQLAQARRAELFQVCNFIESLAHRFDFTGVADSQFGRSVDSVLVALAAAAVVVRRELEGGQVTRTFVINVPSDPALFSREVLLDEIDEDPPPFRGPRYDVGAEPEGDVNKLLAGAPEAKRILLQALEFHSKETTVPKFVIRRALDAMGIPDKDQP